jgi:hypothetical protein
VDQAVEMDPRAVITMSPTEAQAASGGQARFTFAVIERGGVAYSVESAVSSWCRLLLPAGHVGRGELVVDVPDDAGPGRYALRLVATASGQEMAAANVMLRIAGERRPPGESCLKVLPRPKFDLQPDGSVVVTLQVVNCGNVDCHPSYDPCVPFASDVDCQGGSGDGPVYTGTVRVIGFDEYGLDNDGDGVGCEAS